MIMDNEHIKRGIAAYAREQKVFLRLLRKRGSFTESEFDSWFGGREYRRPLGCHGITGETFILGIGRNGFNRWAEMLELLQIMVRLGDVDTKTERGLVVYSLGANA